LRELTREILEGFGYAVLDSAHPQEAIRTAERHHGPIALLITDVMMPDINGRVLAETLTAVRPEMKVLYTSGYAGDVCVEPVATPLGWLREAETLFAEARSRGGKLGS
jgi:two-component system cell cycle sensor histidine kinase/response regulator CckA